MATDRTQKSQVLDGSSAPMDLTQVDPAEIKALHRKVAVHLVPVVVISYIFSFLDRINVGFTKLQMQGQLGITDAVFGLAAGLFFVTYFFFEVPSNILLERIGARVTLLRIMVLWGLTSAATMFVHTPGQFYTERILLGLFEQDFSRE